MKKFRYVFLIIGVIYIFDAIYVFIEPSDSYKLISFEVPPVAYVIFKVVFGISLLYFFKKESEKQ